MTFGLPPLTPNDIITTIGAVTAGVIAWRQKEKDTQLRARDETIDFLKNQVKYLEDQLEKEREKNSEYA